MKTGTQAVAETGQNTRFNILSVNASGIMDSKVEGRNYTLEQARQKYSEICRTRCLGSRIPIVRSGKHNGDIDIMK